MAKRQGTGWRPWGDHPLVVMIGMLVALIAIIGFITGKQNLSQLWSGSSPVPTGRYPETTEGLKRFFEVMLSEAEHGDKAKAHALVQSLIIPNYETWFNEIFGEVNGAKLAADYGMTLKMAELQGGIVNFSELIKHGKKGVSVTRHADPDDFNATGGQQQVLSAMKKPVALYSVYLDGYHLWSFVYVNGGFRIAGKMYRSLR